MSENTKEIKNINWEKIGVYFACLSLGISLFLFLVTQQIQLADIRERLSSMETKLSYYPDPKVEIKTL
jgi:hypothetical protein